MEQKRKAFIVPSQNTASEEANFIHNIKLTDPRVHSLRVMKRKAGLKLLKTAKQTEQNKALK